MSTQVGKNLTLGSLGTRENKSSLNSTTNQGTKVITCLTYNTGGI